MTLLSSSIIRWTTQLLRDGYCMIPDALPSATIAALTADLDPTFAATPFCRGGFYGEATKRFGRLLTRSAHMARLVQHPLIHGVAKTILSPYCDTLQLNVAQAIAVHPGAPAQLPHRDQDMWRAEFGSTEYLLNVIWPLTRFTADNGATLVWPGSHGRNALEVEPTADPIAAAMEPGSALLFLGSTLHGAGANITANIRKGVVVGYALGWLKPYENQWLAYPPEVASKFSPELAALVGYQQHRPNLGNFEGQCPSILLSGHSSAPIGAVDALRPDQEAIVAEFVAGQRASA